MGTWKNGRLLSPWFRQGQGREGIFSMQLSFQLPRHWGSVHSSFQLWHTDRKNLPCAILVSVENFKELPDSTGKDGCRPHSQEVWRCCSPQIHLLTLDSAPVLCEPVVLCWATSGSQSGLYSVNLSSPLPLLHTHCPAWTDNCLNSFTSVSVVMVTNLKPL